MLSLFEYQKLAKYVHIKTEWIISFANMNLSLYVSTSLFLNNKNYFTRIIIYLYYWAFKLQVSLDFNTISIEF